MNDPQYKLSALFAKYRDDALLSKLEEYAQWTIPSVFPREGSMGNFQNASIEYDFQSKGALVVNRLATKLARTLFPANTSFFRMDLSDEVKKLFQQQQIDDILSYENKACERIFLNASYAQLVQAMRLLIITGECLLFRFNDSIRVYSLRNYVAKRSALGDVLELVIVEKKFYSELDAAVQAVIDTQPNDDQLDLYTHVKKTPKGTWVVRQEINGKDIGTHAEYINKLCPYIPVTWNFVNGDNYGRGYVEDYAADLFKLSELSRALAEYELEMLRILHIVNPAGIFDTHTAESAPSGTYVHGDPAAVTPYESGEYNKVLQIRQDLQLIEERLDVAFMYTGNSRDGERVTAYEIRANAEEAEQVLGGVYSQLSQNLHLPLAYLLLHEENDQIIYDIERENLKLNILTGLQALSRSSENQNLVVACSEINTVIPTFTQLGLSKKWNIDTIAESILVANGVNIKSMQYSEEELLQIQQAEQEAQMQQQMQAQAQMMGSAGQLTGQESAVDALAAARQM